MLWLAAILGLGAIGGADPAPAPPASTVTTITLRPATTPRPALKYRILPGRYSLIPGNAAVFYYRADLLMVERERSEETTHPTRSGDDQVYDWVNGPIADLPCDEVRAHLSRHASVIREIKEGVKRDHCDWEFAHRPEGISLLLPEIQYIRRPSRLIDLEARLAIAEGRLDATLEKLEAIHRRKTGALLRASLRMGAIVAGADPNTIGALDRYGRAVGLAFQIVDDLLDVQGDEAKLGKRVGKDQGLGKWTYPGLLGLDGSRRRARELADEAVAALAALDGRGNRLRALALELLERDR